MTQILLLLLVGAAAGWCVGRLLRHPADLGLVAPLAGTLGALSAVALLRWNGRGGADASLLELAAGLAGALLVTIVAQLQAHRALRETWPVSAEDSMREDALADATIARAGDPSEGTTHREAQRAGTATRDNPLLVLYQAHSLRCWPEERSGAPPDEANRERIHWTVEVDGRATYRGPESWPASDSAEVSLAVRRWWDDRSMAARR